MLTWYSAFRTYQLKQNLFVYSTGLFTRTWISLARHASFGASRNSGTKHSTFSRQLNALLRHVFRVRHRLIVTSTRAHPAPCNYRVFIGAFSREAKETEDCQLLLFFLNNFFCFFKRSRPAKGTLCATVKKVKTRVITAQTAHCCVALDLIIIRLFSMRNRALSVAQLPLISDCSRNKSRQWKSAFKRRKKTCNRRLLTVSRHSRAKNQPKVVKRTIYSEVTKRYITCRVFFIIMFFLSDKAALMALNWRSGIHARSRGPVKVVLFV